MKKGLLIVAFNFGFLISFSQSFTSSNLPIVIINTNGQAIPDDPKITADMGIIYNGAGVRNNLADPVNHYNGKIGIEIRGKSSQMFPMKSYSLELRDVAGSSINRVILGMPSESDWVLYAPYTDKTLMRNFLAYTMSREMGRWAARCQFVEVVINDDYKGIYVLMERIKRGSSRVPVTKMTSTDISGDAVTGGYIFSIDKEDPDDDGWYSSVRPDGTYGAQTIRYLYYYPKAVDIAPAQKAYIKSYVDSFENVLKGNDFQNSVTGWRKFADANSFIDYFLVNEVSRNVDAYRLSAFFYKNRNSINTKIMAGPVWDYDLAFRNADYCSGSNINGWSYEFNSVCSGDFWLVPFWWDRFFQDTAFKASLRCRWKQLRQTSLSDQRINFIIDSVNTLVSEAQQRHFQRWPILGQYVWPNPQPIPTTYAGEISELKSWIAARLKWIDENIPNVGACFDWLANDAGTFKVSIAPNPFSNSPAIKILSKLSQTVSIQVNDAAGRVVYRKNVTVSPGLNDISIAAGRWQRGIY
ncbi:MAG: spore coat protein CotH, partial [Chitinophagaceae bacterium]